MSDYIEVEPGLVIDSEGEIIESASIDDAMKFLAARRHEAKQQLKAYEHYIEDLDRVLLRYQKDRKLAYGDVVISVRGGTYRKTNTDAFAELVATMPLEFAEMVALVASATGFKRELVPEILRDAYDECTATLEKRPWIESDVARKPAPVMAAPSGTLLADLEASVEALS